jgi:PAS domain S-box-containing protein
MKIITRLKINTWVAWVFLAIFLISLLWYAGKTYQANQNLILVREIERAALDRVMLRDDWMLYRQERAKIQWYKETETLRKLLETASQQFKSEKAQEILQEAKSNFNATESLLISVFEKYLRGEHAAKEKFVFTDQETRVLSRVILRAYSLNNSIDKLREFSLQEMKIAFYKLLILVTIFVISCFVVIMINSIFLNKLITEGVKTLTDGIKFIGDGHLDYQVPIKSNDELADLAKAINATSYKLAQSYTSMENLQKEISERKKVDENIRKISLHQQALLEAIPDIIMEVDNNKIYTWANERGIDYFGEDVIGKEADFYFVKEQNTYGIVQPIFNGKEDIIYLESWQRRKDGQERLLAWWCHVLKDAQGNVIGALSSARDVTERRQAEEEIKKLNVELEQRVAKRTAELTVKAGELERINKVFVDRELRMRELKARIAELEGRKDYSD